MLVYPTVRCAAAALLARAQRLCWSRLGLGYDRLMAGGAGFLLVLVSAKDLGTAQ